MTELDPLEQRLAALGSGPLRLPGAASVRARGERRRRTRQVGLVVAAVVAAGALGGGVALVSATGGGQDALRTAAAPEPSPTCVLPSEFVTFGPDEEVVYSGSYEPYCSELTIEDGPSAEPSAAVPLPPAPSDPTPSPTTAPQPEPSAWEPTGALLGPDAAAAVELPGWAVMSEEPTSAGPLLDPCGEQSFDDVVARADRTLGSEREAGGSRLVQQVVRYGSEAEAAAAFDALAAAVTRCPTAPAVEGEGTTRFEVAGSGTVDGARTLLVRVQPCGPSGDCNDSYRAYLLLAQTGDGLTDASYGVAEDGDPERLAAPLLDAVAAQLVRAVTG